MERKGIEILSYTFRAAIERLIAKGQWNGRELFTGFDPIAKFPTGSCLLSSKFLGFFLQEKLSVECHIIHLNDYEHYCLLVNGYYVDITADQFPEVSKPVIVEHSSSLTFHRKFVHHEPVENHDIADHVRPRYLQIINMIQEMNK